MTATNILSTDNRNVRYKAKVDAVSPPTSRENFEDEEECFLGVSLENEMFMGPKMDSIVEWVSRRFARCTVLIGDSIHRLTLQAVQNYEPQTALTRAYALGEAFMESALPVLNRFAGNTDFTYVTCGEVAQSPQYGAFLEELTHKFDTDPLFRSSITQFARNYHKRRLDPSVEGFDSKISMSCRYFLEEFAVFCCLRERGLSVMVYPGQFSTLTEITAGDHPDAPRQLRDLVVVSLHLKKKRKMQ